MQEFPIPENETARLAAIDRLEPDIRLPELQALADVASHIAGTPIALVTLVKRDHQTFIARRGVGDMEGTDRQSAFCAHAIMGSEPMVVPDAAADPRFADNPLVTGAPGIGAYAGCPLEVEDGLRLGTLCVIDTEARNFSDEVLEQIEKLSSAAVALLNGHQDRLRLNQALTEAESRRAAAQIMADTDGLTDLCNQTAFRQRIEAALDDSAPQDTLVLIDLDHFKQVNDRLGHAFGDSYLRAIAQALKTSLGPRSILGRLGGDEFGAFLRPRSFEEQRRLMADLRVAVRTQVAALGQPHLGRLSIGMCSVQAAASRRYDELFQKADVALYASKHKGRNRTTIFNRDLDKHYDLRALRSRFAAALSRGEIRPAFLPKVALATGRVIGYELLARWHDRDRGLLPPAYFRAMLEDRAMAPELTRHMIACAVETHRAWRRAGAPPVRLAVNVTAHDLGDPDFFDDVTWQLTEAGLAWRDLTLEVTEATMGIERDDGLRDVMNRIRQEGGDIALDDFGSGRAGLFHLRDWPFDVLKIDASFVAGITEDRRDDAVVAAVLELGRRLGLRVMAEGIETAEVAARLYANGCEGGQGYLYSAPLSRDEALALLLRGDRLGPDLSNIARSV